MFSWKPPARLAAGVALALAIEMLDPPLLLVVIGPPLLRALVGSLNGAQTADVHAPTEAPA